MFNLKTLTNGLGSIVTSLGNTAEAVATIAEKSATYASNRVDDAEYLAGLDHTSEVTETVNKVSEDDLASAMAKLQAIQEFQHAMKNPKVPEEAQNDSK